jgi:hypothetical protein
VALRRNTPDRKAAPAVVADIVPVGAGVIDPVEAAVGAMVPVPAVATPEAMDPVAAAILHSIDLSVQEYKLWPTLK